MQNHIQVYTQTSINLTNSINFTNFIYVTDSLLYIFLNIKLITVGVGEKREGVMENYNMNEYLKFEYSVLTLSQQDTA